MADSRRVVLYHSPQSRSAGTLILLEELGADYELRPINLQKGESRGSEYLGVNPMGKVPAIVDPLRGPDLRWMFFYNASFEPALIDKSMKRDPAPPSTSPYGDYDTVMKTLGDQLGDGPYLLGERFTAVDVLWGTALRWTTMFKLVPETPAIQAYIERVTTRPAALRAAKIDADILAARGK